MENPIFALLGAAGFVAPRHIEAIHSVGGELCCACDKSDSVGLLDRRFPDCQFFLSENELESYVDERKKSKAPDIDFLSVCTPNYLHFSHIAFGLSHGMNVNTFCRMEGTGFALILHCFVSLRTRVRQARWGKG